MGKRFAGRCWNRDAISNRYLFLPVCAGCGNSGERQFHTITVRLKLPASIPPLRIYARAGYYAPER
jgi:hypothetical protein